MANIVLVDDHALLRNGLATLVRNLGHGVLFEADNGKDFIENLKPNSLPDIVLLDINMPEMDGYTTTRIIRRLPNPLGKTPIVALTADAMPRDKEKCLQAGMNNFISKPFRINEIESALRIYLGQTRS